MRMARNILGCAAASGALVLGVMTGAPALADPAEGQKVEVTTPLDFPAPAEQGHVALTFDDLPGLTLFKNQPYVDYFNEMLVRALKRHHYPAIGFVNEGKLNDIVRDRQIDNLKRWLDAGFDLGNHTYSHETPNDLGPKRYIADIERGEPVTRGLMEQYHRDYHYFRHPYLETGFPLDAKREIDHWLAEHHYTIAPVTIDANDWEFAEPYDDAISRHQEERVARIRAQYLAFTERTIAWFQLTSQNLFGRQIPFVMLMHDTRLNADTFDEIAAILKRRNLKPVKLAKAMRDPAYALPDNYKGKDGVDWMERWAEDIHKELPWDQWQDVPQQIAEEYKKADAEAR